MTEPQSSDLEKRYEAYRKGIWDAYYMNIAMLDGRILALSAGLLGFSLTFITKLVNLESASFIFLLVISWILFGASILAVLFGLRYATDMKTVNEKEDAGLQSAGLEGYSKAGPNIDAGKKRTDVCQAKIERYNKSSFWLFVMALVSMLTFISINVVQGNQ